MEAEEKGEEEKGGERNQILELVCREAKTTGKRMVKVDPFPGWLSTIKSPFINSTNYQKVFVNKKLKEREKKRNPPAY